MNLQKPKHKKAKKPRKLNQTQNDHFRPLRHVSLIPIDHIINDEYD